MTDRTGGNAFKSCRVEGISKRNEVSHCPSLRCGADSLRLLLCVDDVYSEMKRINKVKKGRRGGEEGEVADSRVGV